MSAGNTLSHLDHNSNHHKYLNFKENKNLFDSIRFSNGHETIFQCYSYKVDILKCQISVVKILQSRIEILVSYNPDQIPNVNFILGTDLEKVTISR